MLGSLARGFGRRGHAHGAGLGRNVYGSHQNAFRRNARTARRTRRCNSHRHESRMHSMRSLVPIENQMQPDSIRCERFNCK